MILRTCRILLLSSISYAALVGAARAQFDLALSYQDESAFTPIQKQLLDEALAAAEALWERVITGYQNGVTIPSVDIEIRAVNTGLAAASVLESTLQQGIRYAKRGFIRMNASQIEIFASGVDPAGNFNTGLNYMDELMAHEIGHVLGIGTLWATNGLYQNNTFQYTGQHGLAAYRAEFDPEAAFVPVENAGQLATRNAHWDQLMRSSSQEGDPGDPWSLSPLTGITDKFGRDFGLELMTGAIDPDFGEPFLSRTTVHAMRDLGYTVVPEPSTAALLLLCGLWRAARRGQSMRVGRGNNSTESRGTGDQVGRHGDT